MENVASCHNAKTSVVAHDLSILQGTFRLKNVVSDLLIFKHWLTYYIFVTDA